MAKRRETKADSQNKALPRGNRGLSGAARTSALELAKRTTALVGPLVQREQAASGTLGFLETLHARRSQTRGASPGRTAAFRALYDTTMQRFLPITAVPALGEMSTAFRTYRDLYQLFTEMSFMLAVDERSRRARQGRSRVRDGAPATSDAATALDADLLDVPAADEWSALQSLLAESPVAVPSLAARANMGGAHELREQLAVRQRWNQELAAIVPPPLVAVQARAAESGGLEPRIEGATDEQFAPAFTSLPDLYRFAASIQRKAAGAEPPPERHAEAMQYAVLSSGRPLDLPILRAMEAALGADFSDVRVHADAAAARAASALAAQAFAVGNSLYFAQGAYQPHSPAGLALLGHELTHIMQQSRATGGNAATSMSTPSGEPGPAALEAQALGVESRLLRMLGSPHLHAPLVRAGGMLRMPTTSTGGATPLPSESTIAGQDTDGARFEALTPLSGYNRMSPALIGGLPLQHTLLGGLVSDLTGAPRGALHVGASASDRAASAVSFGGLAGDLGGAMVGLPGVPTNVGGIPWAGGAELPAQRQGQALRQAALSGGRPVQRAMEAILGGALGRVRVHTDDAAMSATAALSARTFAVGSDLYFGQGAYQPQSASGLALMGHEPAHTMLRPSIPLRPAASEAPTLEGHGAEPPLLRMFSALPLAPMLQALGSDRPASWWATTKEPGAASGAGGATASGGAGPLRSTVLGEYRPLSATLAPGGALPRAAHGGVIGLATVLGRRADAEKGIPSGLAPGEPGGPASTGSIVAGLPGTTAGWPQHTGGDAWPRVQPPLGTSAALEAAAGPGAGLPAYFDISPLRSAVVGSYEQSGTSAPGVLSPQRSLVGGIGSLSGLAGVAFGAVGAGHLTGAAGPRSTAAARGLVGDRGWLLASMAALPSGAAGAAGGAVAGERAAYGPGFTSLPEVYRLSAEVARKAAGAELPAQRQGQALRQAALSGGRPLERTVQRAMEAMLGGAFGRVRVHTDEAAAGAAAALSARAFAVGSDLYFGQGAYQPESAAGLALLGHELAHTMQGASMPLRRAEPGAPALEGAGEPAHLEAQAQGVEARLLRMFSALPPAAVLEALGSEGPSSRAALGGAAGVGGDATSGAGGSGVQRSAMPGEYRPLSATLTGGTSLHGGLVPGMLGGFVSRARQIGGTGSAPDEFGHEAALTAPSSVMRFDVSGVSGGMAEALTSGIGAPGGVATGLLNRLSAPSQGSQDTGNYDDGTGRGGAPGVPVAQGYTFAGTAGGIAGGLLSRFGPPWAIGAAGDSSVSADAGAGARGGLSRTLAGGLGGLAGVGGLLSRSLDHGAPAMTALQRDALLLDDALAHAEGALPAGDGVGSGGASDSLLSRLFAQGTATVDAGERGTGSLQGALYGNVAPAAGLVEALGSRAGNPQSAVQRQQAGSAVGSLVSGTGSGMIHTMPALRNASESGHAMMSTANAMVQRLLGPSGSQGGGQSASQNGSNPSQNGSGGSQGSTIPTADAVGKQAAAPPAAEPIDLDDMAEKVLSRVKRQLALDHERAGGFLSDLMR